jgi:hypothetical protein
MSHLLVVAFALLSLCATAGWAAGPAAAAAPAAPSPSEAPAATPLPDKRVIEDDNVRIEETRIRGQVSRVTVHNKLGGRLGPNSYEIIVGPGGRDPSQRQDAAGQRAWSVFRF